MLMQCENWRRMMMLPAGYPAEPEKRPAAEGYLLFVARCAEWNEFNTRSRRYLSLLQHARRGARGHASGHRSQTILAAEEIAAHGEARVALGIDEEFVRRYIIELSVLHCGQLQAAKVLEHIERLLLWRRGCNK
jgi:hypothetical protein